MATYGEKYNIIIIPLHSPLYYLKDPLLHRISITKGMNLYKMDIIINIYINVATYIKTMNGHKQNIYKYNT